MQPQGYLCRRCSWRRLNCFFSRSSSVYVSAKNVACSTFGRAAPRLDQCDPSLPSLPPHRRRELSSTVAAVASTNRRVVTRVIVVTCVPSKRLEAPEKRQIRAVAVRDVATTAAAKAHQPSAIGLAPGAARRVRWTEAQSPDTASTEEATDATVSAGTSSGKNNFSRTKQGPEEKTPVATYIRGLSELTLSLKVYPGRYTCFRLFSSTRIRRGLSRRVTSPVLPESLIASVSLQQQQPQGGAQQSQHHASWPLEEAQPHQRELCIRTASGQFFLHGRKKELQKPLSVPGKAQQQSRKQTRRAQLLHHKHDEDVSHKQPLVDAEDICVNDKEQPSSRRQQPGVPQVTLRQSFHEPPEKLIYSASPSYAGVKSWPSCIADTVPGAAVETVEKAEDENALFRLTSRADWGTENNHAHSCQSLHQLLHSGSAAPKLLAAIQALLLRLERSTGDKRSLESRSNWKSWALLLQLVAQYDGLVAEAQENGGVRRSRLYSGTSETTNAAVAEASTINKFSSKEREGIDTLTASGTSNQSVYAEAAKPLPLDVRVSVLSLTQVQTSQEYFASAARHLETTLLRKLQQLLNTSMRTPSADSLGGPSLQTPQHERIPWNAYHECSVHEYAFDNGLIGACVSEGLANYSFSFTPTDTGPLQKALLSFTERLLEELRQTTSTLVLRFEDTTFRLISPSNIASAAENVDCYADSPETAWVNQQATQLLQLLLSTITCSSILQQFRVVREALLLFSAVLLIKMPLQCFPVNQQSEAEGIALLSNADLKAALRACEGSVAAGISSSEILDLLLHPLFFRRLSLTSFETLLDAVRVEANPRHVQQLREQIPLSTLFEELEQPVERTSGLKLRNKEGNNGSHSCETSNKDTCTSSSRSTSTGSYDSASKWEVGTDDGVALISDGTRKNTNETRRKRIKESESSRVLYRSENRRPFVESDAARVFPDDPPQARTPEAKMFSQARGLSRDRTRLAAKAFAALTAVVDVDTHAAEEVLQRLEVPLKNHLKDMDLVTIAAVQRGMRLLISSKEAALRSMRQRQTSPSPFVNSGLHGEETLSSHLVVPEATEEVPGSAADDTSVRRVYKTESVKKKAFFYPRGAGDASRLQRQADMYTPWLALLEVFYSHLEHRLHALEKKYNLPTNISRCEPLKALSTTQLLQQLELLLLHSLHLSNPEALLEHVRELDIKQRPDLLYTENQRQVAAALRTASKMNDLREDAKQLLSTTASEILLCSLSNPSRSSWEDRQAAPLGYLTPSLQQQHVNTLISTPIDAASGREHDRVPFGRNASDENAQNAVSFCGTADNLCLRRKALTSSCEHSPTALQRRTGPRLHAQHRLPQEEEEEQFKTQSCEQQTLRRLMPLSPGSMSGGVQMQIVAERLAPRVADSSLEYACHMLCRQSDLRRRRVRLETLVDTTAALQRSAVEDQYKRQLWEALGSFYARHSRPFFTALMQQEHMLRDSPMAVGAMMTVAASSTAVRPVGNGLSSDTACFPPSTGMPGSIKEGRTVGVQPAGAVSEKNARAVSNHVVPGSTAAALTLRVSAVDEVEEVNGFDMCSMTCVSLHYRVLQRRLLLFRKQVACEEEDMEGRREADILSPAAAALTVLESAGQQQRQRDAAGFIRWLRCGVLLLQHSLNSVEKTGINTSKKSLAATTKGNEQDISLLQPQTRYTGSGNLVNLCKEEALCEKQHHQWSGQLNVLQERQRFGHGSQHRQQQLAQLIFAALLENPRVEGSAGKVPLLEILPHGMIAEAIYAFCCMRFHKTQGGSFNQLLAKLPAPLVPVDDHVAMLLWKALETLLQEGDDVIRWRFSRFTHDTLNPLAWAAKASPVQLEKLFLPYKKSCQRLFKAVAAAFEELTIRFAPWPSAVETDGFPLAFILNIRRDEVTRMENKIFSASFFGTRTRRLLATPGDNVQRAQPPQVQVPTLHVGSLRHSGCEEHTSSDGGSYEGKDTRCNGISSPESHPQVSAVRQDDHAVAEWKHKTGDARTEHPSCVSHVRSRAFRIGVLLIPAALSASALESVYEEPAGRPANSVGVHRNYVNILSKKAFPDLDSMDNATSSPHLDVSGAMPSAQAYSSAPIDACPILRRDRNPVSSSKEGNAVERSAPADVLLCKGKNVGELIAGALRGRGWRRLVVVTEEEWCQQEDNLKKITNLAAQVRAVTQSRATAPKSLKK